MKVNFECPKCKGDELEMVTRNVVESCPVIFEEAGYLNYGDTESFLEGSESTYECANNNCDFVVPCATTPDDLLFAWLKEKGMLSDG